jgi:hypothetical protein
VADGVEVQLGVVDKGGGLLVGAMPVGIAVAVPLLSHHNVLAITLHTFHACQHCPLISFYNHQKNVRLFPGLYGHNIFLKNSRE